VHVEGDETFGGQKVFLSSQILSSYCANLGHSGDAFDHFPSDGPRKNCDLDVASEAIEFSDVFDAAPLMIPPVQSVPARWNEASSLEDMPENGLASCRVELGTETGSVSSDTRAENNSRMEQNAWIPGEYLRTAVSGSAPVTDFALEPVVTQIARLADEKTLVGFYGGPAPGDDSSFPKVMTGPDAAVFSLDLAETVSVLSQQSVQQRRPEDDALTENLRTVPVLSPSASRAQQISIASDVPTTSDANTLSPEAGDLLTNIGQSAAIRPEMKSNPGDVSKLGTLIREAGLHTARSRRSVPQRIAEIVKANDLPDVMRKGGGAQSPVPGKAVLLPVAALPFLRNLEDPQAIALETELLAEQSGSEPEHEVLHPAKSVRLALPVTMSSMQVDTAAPAQIVAGITPLSDSSWSVGALALVAEAAFEVVGGQSVTTLLGDSAATHSVVPRQIVHQMFDATLRAVQRPVDLILNPEELGKVRISMVMAENGITMNILAERPETLDLIRRHVDQLAYELRQIGYGTIGFTFGQHNRGRDAPRAWAGAPEVDVSTAVGVLSQQRQLPSHHDAGLDIRV
jgi:flagellar hook-length control protein FliK